MLDNTPKVCIRDPEFLRDLRYVLRERFHISIGQLDEAIANGFGFKSRAALLDKLKKVSPLDVLVQDQHFRERLRTFQASAPKGLLLNCILDLLPSEFGEVLIGFSDDQKKALGRVKIRLNRVPSEEELEQMALEYESFMSAFQKNASPTNPMEATAINLGDAVDLNGWTIRVGSHNTWLTVIGSASLT